MRINPQVLVAVRRAMVEARYLRWKAEMAARWKEIVGSADK